MNLRQHGIILAIAVVLTACVPTGCRGPTLAPDGPYAGQPVEIYLADASLASLVDGLDAFVKWEFTHRDALAAIPEIHQVAETIRRQAPDLAADALRLRDALERNPTSAALKDFRRAKALLEDLLTQAMAIQQRHQRDGHQREGEAPAEPKNKTP